MSLVKLDSPRYAIVGVGDQEYTLAEYRAYVHSLLEKEWRIAGFEISGPDPEPAMPVQILLTFVPPGVSEETLDRILKRMPNP